MRAILLAVVALFGALSGVALPQQGEMASLEKMIQHFKEVEAKMGQLYAELDRGAVVMVRMGTYSEPIPMRTADLREYINMLNLAAETGRDKPDYDKAEQRAKLMADKLIAGAKETSRKRRESLLGEMSQIRTSRQKAEKRFEQLRLQTLAAKASGANFTGHWNSSVGRFAYPRDLTMTQSGSTVTGSWTHRTGSGTLTGTIKGDVLTFTYTEEWSSNGQSGTDTGVGSFTLSSDGKRFSGTYSSNSPNGDKGNGWRGAKLDQQQE